MNQKKATKKTIEILEWPKLSPLDNYINDKKEKLELGARKFNLTLKELSGPIVRETLILATILTGIGMAEASIISIEPFFSEFALKYGVEQILPSVIWTTHPPELISQTINSNTNILKQVLSPTAEGWAHRLYVSRSIIAGFWGITRIIKALGISREVNTSFRERILEGKETLATTNEAVIRLAGEQSDVTGLSLLLDPNHIIPIYEKPSEIKALALKHSYDGEKPFFWHVPSGEYGNADSWNGFVFQPEWLIKVRSNDPAKNNKKLLIIEADASVGDQALALAKENNQDLDIEEVAQATHILEKVALKNKIQPDEIVIVLLADSKQDIATGGGYKTTLRKQIDAQKEADILIDARAPLILAIKDWAEQVIPASSLEKKIIFNTRNPEYFKTVKKELKKMNYKIVDINKADPKETPMLVYQTTTADTAHTVRTLIAQGIVSPEKCCGLFDKIHGVKRMSELAEEQGVAVIPSICSASIYHDLFKSVRLMLRDGNTPKKIQAKLDKLFPPSPERK